MNKKKLVVMGLCLAMLIPSVCFAEIQKDKGIHVVASAAVGLFLAQNKPFNKWRPWQRVLFNVAVVGGGEKNCMIADIPAIVPIGVTSRPTR